jgi:hypothetical protein
MPGKADGFFVVVRVHGHGLPLERVADPRVLGRVSLGLGPKCECEASSGISERREPERDIL